MFERFSKHARAAVIAAQEQARGLGDARCDSTHLLLAIAEDTATAGGRILRGLEVEPESLRLDLRSRPAGPRGFSDEDADALRSVGIDLDEVRRSVEDAFGPGALDRPARPGRRPNAHLPFTREAKKALELSLREALRLGDRHIGTEHLLLGLVRDERSRAATLLMRHGLAPGRVRDATQAEIARGGDRRGRTA